MMTPTRKKTIALIHICRKDLALCEDTYRALLMRVTKKDSCAAMTDGQLSLILDEFKRLGWKKKNSKRIGARKLATQPQAKMIRGMWLQLRDAGELRDASEESLAAFVKKTSGCNALQWITPAQANRVIDSLRGWIQRVDA